MIRIQYRPSLSAWPLWLSAAFALQATQARADVFEIGKDGQWAQIGAAADGPVSASIDIMESDLRPSGLPPLRVSLASAVPVVPANSPSSPYAPLVDAAAKQFGISPALVDAVMWQESRYNQRAVSSAGAIGLMQLMPGTARYLGVDPHDPWQNVFGGAAYLREQLDRFGNNVPLALAAYNAGPGAVLKHGGIPPYAETRGYVQTITQRLMRQGQ